MVGLASALISGISELFSGIATYCAHAHTFSRLSDRITSKISENYINNSHNSNYVSGGYISNSYVGDDYETLDLQPAMKLLDRITGIEDFKTKLWASENLGDNDTIEIKNTRANILSALHAKATLNDINNMISYLDGELRNNYYIEEDAKNVTNAIDILKVKKNDIIDNTKKFLVKNKQNLTNEIDKDLNTFLQQENERYMNLSGKKIVVTSDYTAKDIIIDKETDILLKKEVGINNYKANLLKLSDDNDTQEAKDTRANIISILHTKKMLDDINDKMSNLELKLDNQDYSDREQESASYLLNILKKKKNDVINDLEDYLIDKKIYHTNDLEQDIEQFLRKENERYTNLTSKKMVITDKHTVKDVPLKDQINDLLDKEDNIKNYKLNFLMSDNTNDTYEIKNAKANIISALHAKSMLNDINVKIANLNFELATKKYNRQNKNIIKNSIKLLEKKKKNIIKNTRKSLTKKFRFSNDKVVDDINKFLKKENDNYMKLSGRKIILTDKYNAKDVDLNEETTKIKCLKKAKEEIDKMEDLSVAFRVCYNNMLLSKNKKQQVQKDRKLLFFISEADVMRDFEEKSLRQTTKILSNSIKDFQIKDEQGHIVTNIKSIVDIDEKTKSIKFKDKEGNIRMISYNDIYKNLVDKKEKIIKNTIKTVGNEIQLAPNMLLINISDKLGETLDNKVIEAGFNFNIKCDDFDKKIEKIEKLNNKLQKTLSKQKEKSLKANSLSEINTNTNKQIPILSTKQETKEASVQTQ